MSTKLKIKIALISLIFIGIFSFSANVIFAQTPTSAQAGQDTLEEAKGVIPLAGSTCGDATGATPDSRKCCIPVGGEDAASLVEQEVPDKFCLPGTSTCFTDFAKGVAQGTLKDNEKVKGIQKLGDDNPVEPCVVGTPSSPNDLPNCTCELEESTSQVLCDQYVKDPAEKQKCRACAQGGVWTGMGCLQTNLGGFIIKNVMTTGISLAGIVTMLCIMYSAYILQFSGGNPERIKKARERLTSCISGLILILFSVFILNLVGVQILRIPGFN